IMYSIFSSSSRRMLFNIALVLGCSLFSRDASAQACGGNIIDTGGHGTAGTEFLVCFMMNLEPGEATATDVQKIYISSVSDAPANVTITCRKFPSFKQTLTLAPRTSQTFFVDESSIINFPPNDAIINSEETVDRMVFLVKSDAPIT